MTTSDKCPEEVKFLMCGDFVKLTHFVSERNRTHLSNIIYTEIKKYI